MAAPLERIYGIDLGTTNSCIAWLDEHGRPEVIPNCEGERKTPSVVLFDDGHVVVGTMAKQSAILSPGAVVEMVKRSMGDPVWQFECNGTKYHPEEISSFVLRKLVQDAEMVTGDKINDVVISCPAYFGVNEREATAQAGKIAGLNVRSIINEPTAVAIAFGLEQDNDQVEVDPNFWTGQ